jgi:peroxiredoxin
VAQLRRTKNHFDEAGFQVMLVGMGTTEETAAFKEKFNVPFPMVSDPEQRLYKEFELGRMSLLDALKPGVVLKGVSALLKGHGVGLPIGDIRQLPGVFIVTTNGKIAYGHSADNPADHPDPQDILNIA